MKMQANPVRLKSETAILNNVAHTCCKILKKLKGFEQVIFSY